MRRAAAGQAATMYVFYAVAVLVIGAVLALLFGILPGIPLLVLGLVGLVLALAARRRAAGGGAIEREPRPEPTGKPRGSGGAPGTANERVGQ
jgi:flagellar biosynthesis component FlhA